MNREKELQDELEKYWGQLDRIEKMLKWLVVRRVFDDEMIMKNNPMYDERIRKIPTTRFPTSAPDISDILEEK